MKPTTNLLQKFRPLTEVVLIAGTSFLIHLFVLGLFYPNIQNNFNYSIPTIYAFFIICSLLIVLLLIKIREKNIDSVGNTFLLVTCIKMVPSYIIVMPLLSNITKNSQIEKFNFFIIFALFLATETVVTIRILNKKQ